MSQQRSGRSFKIGLYWLSQRANSPFWCRTWYDPRTQQTHRASLGTAARPKAILELTTFQVDIDHRVIRLKPPSRPQNRKRRPTLPISSTLVTYPHGIPPGPVVRYADRRVKSIRTAFNRTKRRARSLIRQEGARETRSRRTVGDRAGARSATAAAAVKGEAMLEVTPYVIRHTVATEVRMGAVPLWEAAGSLGHTSGYRTTERYAKIGRDHIANAVRAVDAYLADLLHSAGISPASQSDSFVRASRVRAKARSVVEPRG